HAVGEETRKQLSIARGEVGIARGEAEARELRNQLRRGDGEEILAATGRRQVPGGQDAADNAGGDGDAAAAERQHERRVEQRPERRVATLRRRSRRSGEPARPGQAIGDRRGRTNRVDGVHRDSPGASDISSDAGSTAVHRHSRRVAGTMTPYDGEIRAAPASTVHSPAPAHRSTNDAPAGVSRSTSPGPAIRSPTPRARCSGTAIVCSPEPSIVSLTVRMWRSELYRYGR